MRCRLGSRQRKRKLEDSSVEAVTASSRYIGHVNVQNLEAILEFGANVVLRAGDGQHTENK